MGEFFYLGGGTDQEWVFADGSYVRAHQHASGAWRCKERAMGRSRGGPTTKIHIAADAYGNPIDFEVTGGDVHDAKVAGTRIRKIMFSEYCIADKGYCYLGTCKACWHDPSDSSLAKPTQILAFIYTTLVPGLAATLVWFFLVDRIGAVKAATFHFLNPFIGVAIAAVVLREALDWHDFLGVAIIAFGILAVQLSKQKPTPS